MLERADPRDALVSSRYAALGDLPDGAVVGTSSLRRESQIRARHPNLVVRPLRGNLDTRLAKLDAGGYDAIVLAAAGLERLGLADRIRAILDVNESLPAAGQGALGIEIRADRGDVRGWLAPLASARTTACVTAERAVSRELGGSCQVPWPPMPPATAIPCTCVRWSHRWTAPACCAPKPPAGREGRRHRGGRGARIIGQGRLVHPGRLVGPRLSLVPERA